jgi:hypothetical protein
MDQKALGAELTEEECAFCERYASEQPAAERELALYAELADLDVAPNAESRALVDGALARLAAEAATAERDELTQLKRAGGVPRFVWFSGAAALLALTAAVLLLPRRPAGDPAPPSAAGGPAPRVELVYAAGDVKVDGKLAGSSSMLLAEGSVIEVGQGSACLAMDPDINVCTAEQSRLRLTRTRSVWRRLDLESGEVAVQLSPQPEGWRLSVVADGVWSTAVGTAFTVQRDAELGVRTTVLNGKVRVGHDGGQEQLVAAHQRAQTRREGAELNAISRSDESPEWALLRPAKLWTNPVSSTLEVKGLPPGAVVSLDEQAIGVAPLSTLVPAGAHRLDVVLGGQVVATREFVSEVGQLTSLSFEGQALAVPEPSAVVSPRLEAQVVKKAAPRKVEAALAVQAPAAALPSAGDVLAQARQLMRAERFAEAARQYETLSRSYTESPEARTVLVSLAEVQLDRLGQPRQALDNLERYLSGGSGSLVEEARRVRIRALQALGEREREKSAISEFLQAHPRSFQGAALQRRLADLNAR